MDVEDVDMATLEDILIMGPKYGDQRDEWGKTRDEYRRESVYTAIAQESWEEIVHSNVPLDSRAKELELGGSECYTTVEDQPVIFDDEPRNTSELAKHPERESILVSAGKEIDQLIKEEIGVEVTQVEVKQVTDKFSPTVAFSAVRLLISLTVDPNFTVGLEEAALADVHDGVTNFGSGNVVKCAITVNVNGTSTPLRGERRGFGASLREERWDIVARVIGACHLVVEKENLILKFYRLGVLFSVKS
jgi:hypothetical protein